MRIPVAVRGHVIDLLVDDHDLGSHIRAELASSGLIDESGGGPTSIATDLEPVRTPADDVDSGGDANGVADAGEECGDLDAAALRNAETVGFVVQGANDDDQPKLLIGRSGRVLARERDAADLATSLVSVLASYDISSGLPKYSFRALRSSDGRAVLVDAALAGMLQRVDRRLANIDVTLVPAAELAVTDRGSLEVAGEALEAVGIIGQIWQPQALAELSEEPLSVLAWFSARASWYPDPQMALDHAAALLESITPEFVHPSIEPGDFVEKVSAIFGS